MPAHHERVFDDEIADARVFAWPTPAWTSSETRACPDVPWTSSHLAAVGAGLARISMGSSPRMGDRALQQRPMRGRLRQTHHQALYAGDARRAFHHGDAATVPWRNSYFRRRAHAPGDVNSVIAAVAELGEARPRQRSGPCWMRARPAEEVVDVNSMGVLYGAATPRSADACTRGGYAAYPAARASSGSDAAAQRNGEAACWRQELMPRIMFRTIVFRMTLRVRDRRAPRSALPFSVSVWKGLDNLLAQNGTAWRQPSLFAVWQVLSIGTTCDQREDRCLPNPGLSLRTANRLLDDDVPNHARLPVPKPMMRFALPCVPVGQSEIIGGIPTAPERPR